MAPLTVLKFSSENCGTCHRMSHYNARVVEEPDLAFVGKVLLACYSNKEGMGWPTYLAVTQGEDDFVIRGELRGGMPKGDFRERLSAVLASA